MTADRYIVARGGGYLIQVADRDTGILYSVERATEEGNNLIDLAKRISAAASRAVSRAREADLDPEGAAGKRFIDRVMSHELGIRPLIERGDEVFIRPQGPGFIGADNNVWIKARVLHRNGLHDMWVVQPQLDSPQDEPVHVLEDDIRAPCAYCGGPGNGCCSISKGIEELRS